MKKLFVIVAILIASLASVVAQVPTNPGDPVSVTPGAPAPLDVKNWRDILTPQVCPNGTPSALNTCGDGRDGFVWGWDSFSGRMELRPPKILYGPGAVSTNNALTQNAWTNLYGAVGANGFRTGLTAYVPVGNYTGNVQVEVASGSLGNGVYTIRVLMGTWLQTSGAQQGFLIIPKIATNAITAAGNNTLHFASTAGILPGMVVYDVSTKAAITQTSPGTLVLSVSPTTVTMSTNAAGGGVGNGDTIEFGFAIGYVSQAWPGAAGLPFAINGSFTTGANVGCLAAQNSNQQCEIFTEIFTTDTGAAQLSQAGASAPPPYTTLLNIIRVDGGYGAQ
jgi:hypothetical protein